MIYCFNNPNNNETNNVYLLCQKQNSALIANEAFNLIFIKYLDIANVFYQN